jgi:hypothetical protein
MDQVGFLHGVEYADKKKDHNGKYKGEVLAYLASRGGYKDVLVWLKKQGCVLGRDASGGAAQGGHIKVLKYLKSEGVAFDKRVCFETAAGGHIDVLKYLISERAPFDHEDICSVAAQEGHLDVDGERRGGLSLGYSNVSF